MENLRIFIMEPLIKSARGGGERFCFDGKYEKGRNTVCISPFSEQKNRHPPADDLFRVSLIISVKNMGVNGKSG